jgi:hypothetical protein
MTGSAPFFTTPFFTTHEEVPRADRRRRVCLGDVPGYFLADEARHAKLWGDTWQAWKEPTEKKH